MKLITPIFRIAVLLGMILWLAACSGDESIFRTNPFDSMNTNTATNAKFQLYPVPTFSSGAEQRLRSLSNISFTSIPVGGTGTKGSMAAVRIKGASQPLWMIYFCASQGSTNGLRRFTYTGTNVIGVSTSIPLTVQNDFIQTLGDDLLVQTNQGMIQKYATNTMSPNGLHLLNTPTGLGAGTLFNMSHLVMDGNGSYYALAFSPRAYLIKYAAGGGNALWYVYVGNATQLAFHRTSGYLTVLQDANTPYPKVSVYDTYTGNFIKEYRNINHVFSATQAQVKTYATSYMRRVGDYLYFITEAALQLSSSSGNGSMPTLYFYRWLEGPFSEPVTLWPSPETLTAFTSTDEEDFVVASDFDNSTKIVVYTKK